MAHTDSPYGQNFTRRLVVPDAENLLFQKKPTYAAEHVTLVDYMGGDTMVERVATLGHGRTKFGDISQLGLFHYLKNNGILEPFRSVSLKFQIQARITDALHIVYAPEASANEYSGRYSVMVDSSFAAPVEYLAGHMKDGKNAQAAHEAIRETRRLNYEAYKKLVGEETDFSRELARAPLELNNDTIFFWKIDLVSLMQFIERKRAGEEEKKSTLSSYLMLLQQAAEAVAPLATKALLSSRKYNGELIMPEDRVVIDPLLLPPAWGTEETKRPIAENLETMLFQPVSFLDHGQIQAVDYMGDDHAPVEGARVSYGKGTRKVSEDRQLLRYLLRHRHTTPFELAELAIEAKTPLFTDPRQAGRHRTLDFHGFMGEFPLGAEAYMPADEQLCHQSQKNKQGRGKSFDENERQLVRKSLRDSYKRQSDLESVLRNLGIDEKEIRAAKGVGHYTGVWRTGSLHNWMNFLRLRDDDHAQFEIREEAKHIAQFLRAQCPTTLEAFDDYTKEAMGFSRTELEVLRSALNFTPEQIEDIGIYRKAGLVLPASDGKSERLGREGLELQDKLRSLLGKLLEK